MIIGADVASWKTEVIGNVFRLFWEDPPNRAKQDAIFPMLTSERGGEFSVIFETSLGIHEMSLLGAKRPIFSASTVRLQDRLPTSNMVMPRMLS